MRNGKQKQCEGFPKNRIFHEVTVAPFSAAHIPLCITFLASLVARKPLGMEGWHSLVLKSRPLGLGILWEVTPLWPPYPAPSNSTLLEIHMACCRWDYREHR